MTPWEIEQTVFELDEIRIVIRASTTTQLGSYQYARKAAENASIAEWLEQRIKPIIKGHGVVVVDGNGNVPHGRTRLSTLRASYEKQGDS
ncbi:MAG: hypothetical protein JO264_07775 [Acidisphaera sp.]|nr:hypothetical protein [Acidisphaera sp.]